MPSGGKREYRTNTEAKPVSGPGRLSQRTDMIPSGGAYGERKAMVEQIAAGNRAIPEQPSTPAPKVTGLFAPTEMPQEPVTTGNPLGAGAGPEVMNLPRRSFNPVQTLTRLAASDPTGQIESILSDLRFRGIQ